MTCGIVWANDDHAVCVVDMAGKVVQRFITEHTGKGLAGLVCQLRRAGGGEIAIERPDGKVVDTLLEAGLTVVVISPNQLKNLRGRYGSAGNKDDRFDAFVLADTLRTDRARPAGHARTWSATASRCAISCAPTSRSPSPAGSACSPSSTARSAWPS